jgi:predicted nucleotidyltransferase
MIVPEMGTPGDRAITIADALFSRTQQRVLAILFGEPGRSFFANEIFVRAGAGRGSVQRELERLLASGLVTVRRQGNQKHYQANPGSPVFAEIRSLVLKTSGLADPIRNALQPIARKVELALIYGSVARNEAHAGSDVDLLIVAPDLTLEQLYARLARAEKAIGRVIRPTLYTPEEFRKRRQNSSFVSKVMAGPVITLIGRVDAEEGAR